jgi:hypothetical protein
MAARDGDRDPLRYPLGVLLLFSALNALGGGSYGMLGGAKGIPLEWLAGSPFRDYFIPSLILFAVVGGSTLLAGIAVLARWPMARRLTRRGLGWAARFRHGEDPRRPPGVIDLRERQRRG